MTKFPYDRFAKDYLQELLSPLGSVETSKDVAGEVREIDVYFAPSPEAQIDKQTLGLLGRFAETKALIEPFRNAVTISEVRSCSSKLFDTCARFEREAKRNGTRLDENTLPRLWILSPTASEDFLKGFGAELDEDKWGRGVHFFDKSWRGAVVAIHPSGSPVAYGGKPSCSAGSPITSNARNTVVEIIGERESATAGY
ncbi:hypothetical protein [Aetokthonos hydrillicola]|jgi:hypothetical protein|uniref:hypothetical protein n=1 Tax=Aetokthonos hydrillicola TaxID=1550245 RepID=UPI001B1FCF08|nr:hypothetical protein [Aetokthonos hydrillicola]MBO3460297.1 hypothetical protein [Aetokthonos hydrillicola CCALA 1050]